MYAVSLIAFASQFLLFKGYHPRMRQRV